MSAREPASPQTEIDRLSRRLQAASDEAKRTRERYQAVLDNTAEGVWCCELDEPISVHLSEDEQIAAIFQRARVTETNLKMAEMYACPAPDALVGARLSDLLIPTDARNQQMLRAFIQGGYRLRDAESHEVDCNHAERFFLNNFTGVVENGYLLRAWGSQREITQQLRADLNLNREATEHREAIAAEQNLRLAAENARDLHKTVEEQVTLLIEASRVLLESLSRAEVLDAILRLARRFVAADGYAVWRRDAAHDWHIVSAFGLSDRFQQILVETPSDMSNPPERFVIEDVERAELPAISQRAPLMLGEGLRSFFSLRLKIREESSGFITFYFRNIHRPDEGELRVASALANLAATAITTAELYEEQSRLRAAAEAAQQRSEFLAEASTVLASSLDYEQTLRAVARLAVPRLADWSAVDIVDADGEIRRLAVMHSDPARIELAKELAERYPPRPTDAIPTVVRTGQPVFGTAISPGFLEIAARDADHLAILRQLGIRSYVVMPLLARGHVLGAISLVTSESGRIYTEAEMRLAEELAHRAALAVDNARLLAAAHREAEDAEAALAALRQSNEDLQQFAYVASHDLQEPLRTIASYTQLLSRRYRGRLDESADEFITFVVEAARRMSELIQDLLAYSRAANTPDAKPLEEVDLGEVLAAVRTNLRAAITESGAEIAAAQLPSVKADPAQMVQLLQNLIANAIKYRREEPPRISLDAELRDGEWLVSVADNGIGIEPLYADRIFGIFKRLHGAKYPGTGVGLAICKRIVERHGGTIWVESDGVRGSSFKFTLPSA